MLRRDPLANPKPLIRRVYAYVAYRIGDGPDAEDVTSAAFERALKYRSSFDASRGDPAAWLIGIARREIAEWAARNPDTSPDVPDRPTGRDLAADTAQRLDLRSAVARLEARDRDLIALRYGADLSARAIAELLGLRTNTVEVALHRVLGRLRDELTRDEKPAGSEADAEPAPRFAL